MSETIIQGITYNCDQEMAERLHAIKVSGERVRFYWGDPETGLDWDEEYDIKGRIGNSTGTVKIPILVYSRRSYGGGAIMCGNIVKITETVKPYKVIYEHPTYHKKPNLICDHPNPKDCSAYWQSCTRPLVGCEYRNPLKTTKYWLGRAKEAHENSGYDLNSPRFSFILHALENIVESLEVRASVQTAISGGENE
jgi:hypothetical protein